MFSPPLYMVGGGDMTSIILNKHYSNVRLGQLTFLYSHYLFVICATIRSLSYKLPIKSRDFVSLFQRFRRFSFTLLNFENKRYFALFENSHESAEIRTKRYSIVLASISVPAFCSKNSTPSRNPRIASVHTLCNAKQYA